MPKNQTERQTTDMTENRIKEEEKEGFQFLSAWVFSLSFFLFFSFSTLFEKNDTSNVFFLKGGFVQLHVQFLLHI